MKLLYAIQGTGNGHLSRAGDIIPILQKKGDLDLLVSGIQSDIKLPYEVKYRLKGMSFIFGKKGGVDLWETWKKTHIRQLRREIKAFPIHQYDLVINDFEPVSAWAARFKKVPCIGLSHQAAVLNKQAPKPTKTDWLGKAILNYYAPTTVQYGFHFQKYDTGIFTPIIRQQVRRQQVENKGHYTVYLPAYGDAILIEKLSLFKNVKWNVFSKHTNSSYKEKNVAITPINNEAFIRSMATSEGVLCGAGFETPAEALFLGKKLMVVPMKTQYEQQCNAAALKQMGVPVIKKLGDQQLNQIEAWLHSTERVSVHYPDHTEMIIDKILNHPTWQAELIPGESEAPSDAHSPLQR